MSKTKKSLLERKAKLLKELDEINEALVSFELNDNYGEKEYPICYGWPSCTGCDNCRSYI